MRRRNEEEPRTQRNRQRCKHKTVDLFIDFSQESSTNCAKVVPVRFKNSTLSDTIRKVKGLLGALNDPMRMLRLRKMCALINF